MLWTFCFCFCKSFYHFHKVLTYRRFYCPLFLFSSPFFFLQKLAVILNQNWPRHRQQHLARICRHLLTCVTEIIKNNRKSQETV